MGADNLDGKVGRMYVPRQEIGSIALRKMKVSSSCSIPACCGNHSSHPWQQCSMVPIVYCRA